ncbi:MAG TPA: 23S rRNA (pseudouridine(1915)-N(3))-methyltransferase RlmH, partial [Longimicrobiales bacterium]|nr:23S rRNA (pseudouridine(1915)-N(3))-methyltransferase RlmH [Longimicrobiales bacterium]
WKLEVVEVEAGARRGEEPEEVVAAEAERILARLPREAGVVALTRKGKGMTSRGLARWLSRQAVDASDVAFVIGGAWGLDAVVLERASRHLSLSPMTLPHEVARLCLAEQLYRAGTIVRGEPYHKGP